MHNKHHEPPDTSMGFEQSDLSLKGIKLGVVFYFIFTAVVGGVVFMAMIILGVPVKPQDMPPRRLPPEPNPILQNNVTARSDIWNLRTREDFLLNNVSWVSQKDGVVRIPINEALDKAAKMGPAGLATLPKGYEAPSANTIAVGGTVSPAGVKPPNTSTGAEMQGQNVPPSGKRQTVPEGGR